MDINEMIDLNRKLIGGYPRVQPKEYPVGHPMWEARKARNDGFLRLCWAWLMLCQVRKDRHEK
jgi:hypothetical protein